MSEMLFIDPKTSALLVMDFQRAIVEGYATDADALLARTSELITAVRKSKMMVVYVVVSFRPGYPEVSSRNLWFGAIRSSGRFVEASVGSEVHSAVAPMPEEVVVKKHRVGAFSGTVVRDCCGDRDPEVHRVLTEKVFPRQATVTDAESTIKVLS